MDVDNLSAFSKNVNNEVTSIDNIVRTLSQKVQSIDLKESTTKKSTKGNKDNSESLSKRIKTGNTYKASTSCVSNLLLIL